jgi:hypothetical protein
LTGIHFMRRAAGYTFSDNEKGEIMREVLIP